MYTLCKFLQLQCPKIPRPAELVTLTCCTKLFSTSQKLNIQPRPCTHPYLLKDREVTFGLNLDVYRKRRQKFFELIADRSSDNTAHLVVIPASSITYMSDDIPYFFRQNTDFLYFCGFKEPNSVLLLCSRPSSPLPNHESILLIPKPSARSVKWEGPKMDLTQVTEFLGVDKAVYMDQLEAYLISFAKSFTNFTLWYTPLSNCPNVQLQQLMQDFIHTHSRNMMIQPSQILFHELRVIKSPEEIDLLRASCHIGAESMKEVMTFSHPSVHESHLHAKMEYECRVRGADFLSFPPVIAGGSRANTIHYLDNNHIVKDGEMVLIDSGCEYHGYSSDLSRTWPVNGKFTDAQKELYESILFVQEELIQICQPGISLDELLKLMCFKLSKYWKELGLVSKSASENESYEAAFDLCPHHVSHYLGMDVHDTNKIFRSIPLQPGMVVTIEPGAYIPIDQKNCPQKFRGLGIRIEDNLLITEDGNEVLTSACPKHVGEIEELFRKKCF